MNRFDVAYSLAVAAASPVWLALPKARRKVFKALRERMGRDVEARNPSHWAVMIHAVSLGEMNATKALVDRMRKAEGDLQFVVSTTTDTGFAAALRLYDGAMDVTVIRYPLDFSGAIQRVLDRVRPAIVVLMELEVWPNFVRHCEARGVPVVVANGRVSTGSFRSYRRGRALMASTFRRLTHVCAQDELYAERFVALGVPPERVTAVGSMKFDNAQVAERILGDVDLAEAVGLFPGPETIWVCGSTGPGEEEIVLRVYRQLLARNARLRLVIVPRKPERFDEVAELIEGAKFRCVRRSRNETPPAAGGLLPPVVLGDTMGELRKFYSLADVIFVGRSLVDLGSKQHGSDMIEAAALGRPVVVGPWTGNFADAMRRLRQAEAILIAQDEAQLLDVTQMLLSEPARATAMARRAQDVVNREQGATDRHVRILLDVLHTVERAAFPAIVK